MKNEKYLQITAIVFVLIIIGLSVGLILMGRGSEERESARKTAVDNAAKLENEKRDLTQQVLTLKQLIGHQDDTSIDDIKKEFDKAMKVASAPNGVAQNYRTALNNVSDALARKNEEHAKSQNTLEEQRANYANLKTLYDTVVQQTEESKQKAVDDLVAARKDFQDTSAANQEKFAALEAAKRKGEDEALAQIRSAAEKAQAATTRADQIKSINDELTGVLGELRRTNFDRPDGKILSVSQQSGLVTINLGSDDGLMTRMTFSVYPPSITGISYGVSGEEQASVICEVCKREQSLNASKASVEITRILGPHRAEARILDDLLTDPVVAGDVVYTPVWKPGQTQHFALGAGIRIPGVGKRDGGNRQSDLEELMRLIKANGGVVDAYINDSEDTNVRGTLEGAITRDTTFLVIGDLDVQDNTDDQKTIETQNEMVRTAREYSVQIIGLRDFLSRMGWKNVTPIRGFGHLTTESDLRIEPTGARLSTGTVSPLYQGYNPAARVNVKDRASRTSTGTVSGLYSDAPRTISNGQTSELFRPRKPATSPAE